jgi:hypothetical protein
MESATEDVQRVMSAPAAQRKYCTPRIMLLYKVKCRHHKSIKWVKIPVCLQNTKDSLLNGSRAKAGFPITTIQLLDSMENLLLELKINYPSSNGHPGKLWFQTFLDSTRILQNLTSRTLATKAYLGKWFEERYTFLVENNCETIITYPRHVYNADETAIFNPKYNKVLAAKDD